MSAEWMDRAECLTVDPEVMQPERATVEEVADAKALCGVCPVRAECHQLAVSQTSPLAGAIAYGVHAGRWWGPEPVWEVERVCDRGGCGEVFRTEARGHRSARFCSGVCRSAAYRDQQMRA